MEWPWAIVTCCRNETGEIPGEKDGRLQTDGCRAACQELAHPGRFSAFVAEVPLTDMRKYHRWLAGHSWLEEYGDPDENWEDLR